MPAATYAYNDAEVVREYLADTLGFSKQNIRLVVNSKATHAEFERLLGLNGWLKRNVQQAKSDVVVYFSGHGIPDAKASRTAFGQEAKISKDKYIYFFLLNKLIIFFLGTSP